MVEGEKIHGTGPFIFFTGDVNSDNSQKSELPKQQFQLIIQNFSLKKTPKPMNVTQVKLF